VRHLLGLSHEHITQFVLLPQGRLLRILRATPANRQKLLVELLAFGVSAGGVTYQTAPNAPRPLSPWTSS
jgi:DNA repair exonuclease SbcCD ATPase subunit